MLKHKSQQSSKSTFHLRCNKMTNTPRFMTLSLTNATPPYYVTANECRFPVAQASVLFAISLHVALFGTFGNILTIVAILDTPQLRQKVSSALLLSLAVADLIVSAAGNPLFCGVLYLAILHRCNHVIEVIYVVVVVLAGWSSIFHLAAISIDRVIATTRPHQHQGIMRRWWKAIIVFCWGSAMLSGCLIIPFPKMQIALLIQFVLSVVIIMSSYGVILYKIKFPDIVTGPASMPKTEAQIAMEKQVARTIVIVIFLFILCWFPIHIIIIKDINKPTIEMKYWWTRSLYLAKSSLNFVVYALRIRQFRLACARIINRTFERIVSALRKRFPCACFQ